MDLPASCSKGVAPLLWGTKQRAQVSAIPQCPAPKEPKWKVCFSTRWVRRWKRFGMTWVYGWGDEGEHWAMEWGGGGLISLYPVWRAVAGLDPHQLSTFLRLPVAVQSKAGLSADGLPGQTSVPLHPLLLWIYSSPYPPPESPHLSTPAWPWGAVIKRWRGLELGSGGAGPGHWQGSVWDCCSSVYGG